VRGGGQFRKRAGWTRTRAVETLRRAVLPPTSDLLPYLIQAPKKMAMGPESCNYECRLDWGLFKVSAFRNGQLGGGCLVSFPQAELQGRRSLIRFFVAETRLRRQVGKSDLTNRDFSIPSASAQVWRIKFRRHSVQII
jgi:hypothetical protein